MENFAERLSRVQEAITAAAQRAGRPAEEVQLVAVSKTHPPEAVADAVEAGQTLFGESRVQEARAKIPASPGRARWHFIGHLQKNKIRHALPLFELFHGVDSLTLAQELDAMAGAAGLFPRILLEVNIAGESTKHGFRPAQLREQLEQLLTLERVQIDGLMTIAPFALEPEASRSHFAELRELRDRVQSEFRLPLPQLSMGMSGDYTVAVEEGATLVRVGTALFGRRSGKGWRPGTEQATFDD
jgi:pyridoxal phosphate enzyme (YggS family)